MELDNPKVRIQKLLANAGLGSRRTIEQYIVDGRISINGHVATLGDKANSEDQILFDGEQVKFGGETKWFLLNKPLGVVSSVSDEKSRTCVVDLIDTDLRIYPVGRLDINTTGLLILTNDGELTHKLTHPSFSVDKKYVVQITGNLDDDSLTRLRNGIELEDGVTSPAQVKVVATSANTQVLEIVIHEGRNRQIRRMIEAIGSRVETLHRSKIGPIEDKSLKLGQYRELTLDEVHSLYAQVKSGE